jgi:hypothetical protein
LLDKSAKGSPVAILQTNAAQTQFSRVRSGSAVNSTRPVKASYFATVTTLVVGCSRPDITLRASQVLAAIADSMAMAAPCGCG